MVGVNEELGRTVTPYTLPPDSPNLRMLMATVNERQREAYLAPYVRGETISAIGISEPGAGGDPAGMTTRAERDGDDWIINGRKIWISRAAEADFTILMAVTDKEKARARRHLGLSGRQGHARLQRAAPHSHDRRRGHLRDRARGLPRRRLEAARQGGPGLRADAAAARHAAHPDGRLVDRHGAARAGHDVEYAPQRVTFGLPLSERQAIQWWVADAATTHPRRAADDLRLRLEARPGPRRARWRSR